MQSTTLTRAGALGAVVAVCAVAAAPAMAADTTVKLQKAGDTRLTLDKGAAKALKSLKVAVTPISPSKVKSGAVAFGITGGTIDPKLTAGASIDHSGGLQLKGGGVTVKLQKFRISVGKSRATISALVGKSRVTIINLDLAKAKVTRPSLNVKVANVGVKLNATGASALNKAFGVKAFKKGLKLGTAVVDARLAELIVESGETKLTVDGGTLGVLTGAGIAPGVVAPTALTAGVANFPITTSKIAANLSSGTIGHTGGLTLTKGATTIKLSSFDIKLGSAPTLAAAINDGATKADILDLDVSGLKQSVSGQTVTLSGITAKLNATAAGAVSGLAGATVPAGVVLGTAVVTATVR